MSAKNQPSEIALDRNKTFSFLSIGNYVNSEQLLNEIAETVRRLVESGKDTMLVRWSYGLERIVSDCFLALRDEFPKLRTIKVTYSEDSCQGISKHADGLVISLDINNTRKLSIEDFMFQNSSTIICHISYSLYKKSKLKKYAQQIGNLEVINLFTPILQNAREKELYRLILVSTLPKKLPQEFSIGIQIFLMSFQIKQENSKKYLKPLLCSTQMKLIK